MLRPGELELAAKLPANGCAPAVAQEYTRWLATHHYENFNVASWLLPKELHQHFYNLYAYCRWADDLGDEIPSRERALELLDWWETELDALLRRAAQPSGIRGIARNNRCQKCAQAALRGSSESVSAGSGVEALSHLGFRSRLLRVFRESRWAAGALSVRVSRRRPPKVVRCHLHGAAVGKFLARCFTRPGHWTHLHSPRQCRRAWSHGE